MMQSGSSLTRRVQGSGMKQNRKRWLAAILLLAYSALIIRFIVFKA